MTDDERDREYEAGKRAGLREASRRRTPQNPNGAPTGHYTGRCGNCGSADLWDDNMAYGCNHCGGFWCFN